MGSLPYVMNERVSTIERDFAVLHGNFLVQDRGAGLLGERVDGLQKWVHWLSENLVNLESRVNAELAGTGGCAHPRQAR